MMDGNTAILYIRTMAYPIVALGFFFLASIPSATYSRAVYWLYVTSGAFFGVVGIARLLVNLGELTFESHAIDYIFTPILLLIAACQWAVIYHRVKNTGVAQHANSR